MPAYKFYRWRERNVKIKYPLIRENILRSAADEIGIEYDDIEIYLLDILDWLYEFFTTHNILQVKCFLHIGTNTESRWRSILGAPTPPPRLVKPKEEASRSCKRVPYSIKVPCCECVYEDRCKENLANRLPAPCEKILKTELDRKLEADMNWELLRENRFIGHR